MLWASLLILQAAVYMLTWSAYRRSDALYGTDFVIFYTAGRLVNSGHRSQLYDLDAQRAVQAAIPGLYHFAGGANLFQHPPFLAPLLAFLALADFSQAFIWWTLVRIGIVAACTVGIFSWLSANHMGHKTAFWMAISSAAFYPLFLSLLGGQDTVFVLAGLLFWFAGLKSRQDIRAGLGLAWATLSPTIAGALGLITLASRRRAAVWFIVGSLVLGLYSLALVGWKGSLDFISLLRLSSSSDQFGLNPTVMYNFLGLLMRLFPGLTLSAARQAAWIFYIAFIASMCLWWWRNGSRLRVEHMGIALLGVVFLSPHLHIHSLSYLLIPLLGVGMVWFRRGGLLGSLSVGLIPLSSISILLASLSGGGMVYYVVYGWMVFLVGCLVENLRHPERDSDFSAGRAF